MRHRGEGRTQRYSAADRNIGTISKRLGGQDIRVGAPTTTTTTTTATTTPRYVEGTKHHGSGRRTRIREILLEYQPAPFRSSSILCFRIGVWRKGGEGDGSLVVDYTWKTAWICVQLAGCLDWRRAKSDPLSGATDKSKIWHEKESAMKDDSVRKSP